MKYVIDIDGTICTLVENGNYLKAKPIKKRIDEINRLYDEGHTIIYQTARGMGRHENVPKLAIYEFQSFTAKQLHDWGAKHHALFLGKPAGDVYIDDKAINATDFFGNDIENEVC